MLVKEMMQDVVPTTQPERSAVEALEKMVDIGVHFLPVIDEQRRLVGMLSESDFVRACYPEMTNSWRFVFEAQQPREFSEVAKLLAQLKVSNVMAKQVTVVTPEQEAEEVIHLLVAHRIHQVPVVDERGHLLGVVTRRNIIKHLLRAFAPYVAETEIAPLVECSSS
jgi:CBS-domain-containing membrane protein